MVTGSHLWAYPLQEERTLGTESLLYQRKANLWAEFDFSLFDGSTRTRPPNTLYLDRRLNSFLSLGSNVAFSGGRFGLRAKLNTNYTFQKQKEQSPPQTPRTTKVLNLHPALSVTYLTSKGIEIVGGLKGLSRPKEAVTSSSASTSSNIHYDPLNFYAYHFALVKRGSSWSGSVYHQVGANGKRSFKKTSSDGTNISGHSRLQIPPEFGIAARFSSNGFLWNFDLASVQASEGGEKTTDGISIEDDYLRLCLSLYTTRIGGRGLKATISHKTLSYSDNSYTTIDSIPITSFSVKRVIGNQLHHDFLGAFISFGNDGSSITEYNAEYKVLSMGLSVGTSRFF